jgi:hypothetical protein
MAKSKTRATASLHWLKPNSKAGLMKVLRFKILCLVRLSAATPKSGRQKFCAFATASVGRCANAKI